MRLIILISYVFYIQIEGFTYMDPIRGLDQICIFNNTQKGKCKRASACAGEVVSEADLERSTICKYEGVIPVFCCPESLIKSLLSNRTASRMCKQYLEIYYDDKKMEEKYMPPSQLESMDQNDLESSFPHVAQIGKKMGNEIKWECGGTLIAPKFLLTVSHCVSNMSVIRMVGDIKKEYNIEKITPYNNSIENDIAIIELTNSIEFNDRIRPSCLSNPEKEDWNWMDENAVVSGFGFIDENHSLPNKLRAIRVHHLDNESCSEMFGSEGQMINMDKAFCYGNINTRMTTCRGDSGSPLEHIMMPLTVVIGLVTKGLGNCDAEMSPTIFTRISYYMDWIEENVWPEN